jgi:hypothetical protein
MQHSSKPFLRWTLIISVFLLLSSCILIDWISPAHRLGARRVAAQELWATRPFSGYQLVLRVEYLNQICRHTIEVRGEQMQKLLNSTCQPGPFSLLSITRLFELSQRLEQPPLCYADSPCVCHLLPSGTVSYDQRLGYPAEIVYQPTIEQNWAHVDFWKRAWEIQGNPSCGSGSLESLHISVTSLVPLR